MTIKENAMQELEKLMTEFVEVTRTKYDGYAYPVGYLMSMIQTIADENPKVADRLIRNFKISLEDYK